MKLKQIIHSPVYKSSSTKYVTLSRIFFNKEYTKIDFGFDHTKIKYIKDTRVLISPGVYMKTKNKKYNIITAHIYKSSYFKSENDIRYFSLRFEPIGTEEFDSFDIVDDSKNSFSETGLHLFWFKGVQIEKQHF